MKHIIKLKNNKKSEEEILFNANDLVDNSDPSIKIQSEYSDEIRMEFKKSMNEIEKFENFLSHVEIDDDIDNEIEADYEEDPGCGCCGACSGQPGCDCKCVDCKCANELNIIPASHFVSNVISEGLKYHLENNKPITENVYRPGSEAFFEVIKEARQMFDMGRVKLCDIDKEIFESTEIGKFAYFKGELVPLDLPMENIIESNKMTKCKI